ncbi:MAG: hypothetical protein ACKO0M_17075 [Cyanobium sp.]
MRAAALCATALISCTHAARAEKLGDLCGERLNREILAANPEIKPGYSTGGAYTLGRDGCGIERGINGLSIRVRWTSDSDWTACEISSNGTSCGNLFDIGDGCQEALDGGGPNPADSGCSSISVISKINGQSASAALVSSRLTACAYHRDRPVVRDSVPNYGSLIGRKYQVTYSWTARYAIEGTSKQFDIDYRYDGTTTRYHEKAAF